MAEPSNAHKSAIKTTVSPKSGSKTSPKARPKNNKSSDAKKRQPAAKTNKPGATRKKPIPRKRKPPVGIIPLQSLAGQKLLHRNSRSLSIIITVHNEESTIREALGLVMQLKPKEIIIIENGSTDRTPEICKEYPVRCFSYPFRLGHDVGRALGAKEAEGEVLLFLDGDIPVNPSSLLPFVKSCYEGTDVALNDLNPFYEKSSFVDYVSKAKYYLNRLMMRPDLAYCSLTAVPHAMRKSAALAIGLENLAVPPKAHAIALFRGLKVKKAATVNVFRLNKFRAYHNKVGHMILGDHIEAISWLQEQTSDRVKFPDRYRIRSYADLPIQGQ